ncbi:polysaccharide deacetylase family protein [Cytobacillus sp. IB215665]|uniref:polysaccharide deacetylase family protein n=1 Tax=Cytobacillus sp. IB215665 TaxID=3097357 RepID=UPI002A177395|nr:polysaccharide deacetylase family protein [Cytobacillus sp. IB215665]MDX8363848.1 polysaccharide deacetylase family protein [Cytobacillus sp. IB215665]
MKSYKMIFTSLSVIAGLFLLFAFVIDKERSVMSVGYTSTKAIQQTNIIEPISAYTPVYDNRKEEFTIVGYLQNGHTFKILRDYGNEWWQISFGNGYGYVRKTDVIVNEEPYVLKATKNTNNMFITIKETNIYEQPSDSLHPIATISQNLRYPIMSESNDYYGVKIAGKIGYVQKEDVEVDDGIPILMYHHFSHDEDNLDLSNPNTISPHEFYQQMAILNEEEVETISLKDLEGFLNGTTNLPGKVVALTFDDGLQSVNEYVYPTLKANNQLGNLFIITSRSPNEAEPYNPKATKYQFMSTQMIENMSDVFTVCAHTHKMHRLKGQKSFLVTKSLDEVQKDLRLNKSILETAYFAYPFGQYNEDVVKVVMEEGFKMAFTTKRGFVKKGDNPYLLNRLNVSPRMTKNEYKKLVGIN